MIKMVESVFFIQIPHHHYHPHNKKEKTIQISLKILWWCGGVNTVKPKQSKVSISLIPFLTSVTSITRGK